MAITPVAPISAVQPISAIGSIGATQAPTSTSTATATPFNKLVDGMIANVNRDQVMADQAIEQFALGKSGSLNDVVLATAKADLSLQLLVEIRNKLMDSYQEIMRMQV